MGDAVYEDSPDGSPAAVAEPSTPPVPVGPIKAMLRIKLRSTADGPAHAVPHSRDGEPGGVPGEQHPAALEDSQSFAVLADRLTVDSGSLSLWHADEVVFCCPVAALASIAFEVLGTVRLASPSAEQQPDAGPHVPHAPAAAAAAAAGRPDDPYLAAHRDLASANTRWTAQDERRLVELHAAGISIDVLARTFGRRKGAVRARLFKLRRDLEAGPDIPTA